MSTISLKIESIEASIVVTDTSASRAVTLPPVASFPLGKVLTIKDEAGNAATHNIVITPAGSERIDGNATKTISANSGSARIYSNGTGWISL